MRLATGARSVHLTYCGNVHPTPDADALIANLDRYARPLAARFARAGDGPMAAGLYFGADAGRAFLDDPARRERLAAALDEAGVHALTANAFPLGAFHEGRVKERVYRPDWNEDARARATLDVARLMAALPCAAEFQTVSTMPGAWKAAGGFVPGDAARRLADVAVGLGRIEAETGRRIVLAVEPEPGCVFETTAEWIAFYEGPLRRAARDEALLRRHVGTCFDCCHQAVEFEDARAALDALAAAGIPVAKMQLSSALRIPALEKGAARIAALERFAEPRYLHQVMTRSASGALRFVADLPEWLADPDAAGELRCHFHVPIFAEALGELGTTRGELERALDHALARGLCTHFEVETYTWGVMPKGGVPAGTDDARLLDDLERELAWARDRILASSTA